MTRKVKAIVIFGAITIILSASYFVWFQSEDNVVLASSSYQDHGAEQNVIAQAKLNDIEGSNLAESDVPKQASLTSNQPDEPINPQRPERLRTRNDGVASFSPILDQVVSREQISDDIATYIRDLDNKGLLTYLGGDEDKPVYGLLDGVINNPNSLHKEFDKNVEELVELAQQGDPAAMLSLANRAWAAGHWPEGDVYAFEAAKISESSEPLLHGASQRLTQSGIGFQDPEGASWFLAAYLSGEIAAAEPVAAYFRFMSPEHQVWALQRALEIMDEVNNGG